MTEKKASINTEIMMFLLLVKATDDEMLRKSIVGCVAKNRVFWYWNYPLMYWKFPRMLKQHKTQSKSDKAFHNSVLAQYKSTSSWRLANIRNTKNIMTRNAIFIINMPEHWDHWVSFKQPSHITRAKLFTENSVMPFHGKPQALGYP